VRLYSNRDIVQILEQALRDKGFSVTEVKRGTFEVSQWAGFVSQRFKIKVDSVDCDPV
jgi:hypothetical protein